MLLNGDDKGGSEERERVLGIALNFMEKAADNYAVANYGNTDESVESVTENIETACMYAVKWCFTE